jgi:hypothetical protein
MSSGRSTPTLGGSSPLHFPLSHDPASPDLSYPSQTTDPRAGYTNEYRATTHTGLVTADAALTAVQSRASNTHTKLNDVEAAKEFGKGVKLVTWKDNDPEDPRQWSSTYRWCK